MNSDFTLPNPEKMSNKKIALELAKSLNLKGSIKYEIAAALERLCNREQLIGSFNYSMY